MVKRLSTMWETWVLSLGWEVPWRKKWQPTPVLLPRKSHGRRSLVSMGSPGVHGVAKGRTRLSDFTFTFVSLCVCNCCLHCCLHCCLLLQTVGRAYIHFGCFSCRSVSTHSFWRSLFSRESDFSYDELCDGLWIDLSLIHLVPIPALSLNLLAHLFKPHNLILCRYEMF